MITTEKVFLVISRTADILAITGLSAAALFGWIKHTKTPTGFMINQFINKFFKCGLILVLYLVFSRSILVLVYSLTLLLIKGNLIYGTEYWESGKEIQHVLAYLVTAALTLPLFWIIGTTIWTSSFEHTLELINLILPKSLKIQTDKFKNDTSLDIISAIYKTDDDHFTNVTEQIKRMVSNNKLEVTASNDLGGDPHKGFHKNLVINYRINGIEKTEIIPEYRTGVIPS